MKTTTLNQIKDHILDWSLGNLSQDDCEIKDNKLYFYQLNHYQAYANTPVGRYHFTETEIEATASISVVGDTIHCLFTDAYSLRTINTSLQDFFNEEGICLPEIIEDFVRELSHA